MSRRSPHQVDNDDDEDYDPTDTGSHLSEAKKGKSALKDGPSSDIKIFIAVRSESTVRDMEVNLSTLTLEQLYLHMLPSSQPGQSAKNEDQTAMNDTQNQERVVYGEYGQPRVHPAERVTFTLPPSMMKLEGETLETWIARLTDNLSRLTSEDPFEYHMLRLFLAAYNNQPRDATYMKITVSEHQNEGLEQAVRARVERGVIKAHMDQEVKARVGQSSSEPS